MASLKQDITDYLRIAYPEWRSKPAIEKFALAKGYSAENGTRRARELSRFEPGKPPPILIKDPDCRYARYKFNAKDYPTNTVHISKVSKHLRQRSEYRNQAMLF